MLWLSHPVPWHMRHLILVGLSYEGSGRTLGVLQCFMSTGRNSSWMRRILTVVTPAIYMIKTKAFHGRFFLTVWRGANRTVDSRIKKSAPHRTLKNKKCTAPHRKIWLPSVEQACLTVRIELIRRTKPPRTVSSNYVNRVKCNDLYDESFLELQNWCKARRLRNEVPGGYIAINTYMMPVYTGMISLTFGRKSRTISYLYGLDLR